MLEYTEGGSALIRDVERCPDAPGWQLFAPPPEIPDFVVYGSNTDGTTAGGGSLKLSRAAILLVTQADEGAEIVVEYGKKSQKKFVTAPVRKGSTLFLRADSELTLGKGIGKVFVATWLK